MEIQFLRDGWRANWEFKSQQSYPYLILGRSSFHKNTWFVHGKSIFILATESMKTCSLFDCKVSVSVMEQEFKIHNRWFITFALIFWMFFTPFFVYYLFRDINIIIYFFSKTWVWNMIRGWILNFKSLLFSRKVWNGWGYVSQSKLMLTKTSKCSYFLRIAPTFPIAHFPRFMQV